LRDKKLKDSDSYDSAKKLNIQKLILPTSHRAISEPRISTKLDNLRQKVNWNTWIATHLQILSLEVSIHFNPKTVCLRSKYATKCPR
jgi:hypothetical protein